MKRKSKNIIRLEKKELCKKNHLLAPPKIILHEEFKKTKRSCNLAFLTDTHGYSLRYLNGQISFTLKYYGELPDELIDQKKSKFSVKDRIIDEEKIKVFTYKYGDISSLQEKDKSKINSGEEYHIASPRDFRNEKERPRPQKINIEQFAEFIINNKVVFYTGAGVSIAGGVHDIQGLKDALGIDLSQMTDKFINTLLSNPEKAKKMFQQFCRSAFENPPTPAHKVLAELAKIKSAQIMTENFDFLQERTGIKSYRTRAGILKEDVQPKELKQIDVIICIGLDYDDKGFLAWYKKNNQNGKIVSLDLNQPGYLGNEDYFIKGNLQKVLRKVEKQIKMQKGPGCKM